MTIPDSEICSREFSRQGYTYLVNPVNATWIGQTVFVSRRFAMSGRMAGYRARYGRILYRMRKISNDLYMVTRIQ